MVWIMTKRFSVDCWEDEVSNFPNGSPYIKYIDLGIHNGRAILIYEVPRGDAMTERMIDDAKIRMV